MEASLVQSNTVQKDEGFATLQYILRDYTVQWRSNLNKITQIIHSPTILTTGLYGMKNK